MAVPVIPELIGYQHFFVWVILATIPSFILVLLIPLDKGFGKKAWGDEGLDLITAFSLRC